MNFLQFCNIFFWFVYTGQYSFETIFSGFQHKKFGSVTLTAIHFCTGNQILGQN